MLTHVVLFWLKEPEIQQPLFQEACFDLLQDIPGVKNFRCGAPVKSERPVVDDSFTTAISMDFDDEAALAHYAKHPKHIEFVENFVKEMADKYTVYDWK